MEALRRPPSDLRDGKLPVPRSARKLSGYGCRWSFIRFPPVSKAAWPVALSWPCWRCCTASRAGTAFGIQSIFWRLASYLRPETGDHGATFSVSTGRAVDCRGDSPAHLADGRAAVRRDASNAAAAADSAGRLYRPAHVVWPDSRHSWNRESRAQPTHRLGLVCGLANGIRNCGGICRFAFRKDTHGAAHATRPS